VEDATSIANSTKFWRRQLVELNQVLICGRLGVSVAVIRALEVFVEALEASQNSSTRMLDGSQARLDVTRKAVPELLWAVPMAQMSGIVAESIAVFGASGAGRVDM